MVLGKFVQRFSAEVSRQHRPAKSDYATLCQQPQLDGGEIAVAANKQRILLLARDQRLPVNLRQQASCAVAAAYRQHDAVYTGEGGELVDIGKAFILSSGKAQRPAGNDFLVRDLVPGLLQTLHAAIRRLLVDAVTGRGDEIKLRHDNSLLRMKGLSCRLERLLSSPCGKLQPIRIDV